MLLTFKRYLLPAVLLLLVVSLLIPVLAVDNESLSTDARIVDLDVKVDNRQLLFSFRLVGAFSENLQRRIDSGLPTSLLYRFELIRNRRTWFDKRVAASEVQVIAMYNAVTREYLINYKHDGTLTESRVVRDVDGLVASLTEFERFPTFTLEPVEIDQRLRARVRAELGTRTMFFFIPTKVTTDWADTTRLSPSS